MGCADLCDTAIGFLRKFFSLIVALLMAFFTLLFVIGAGRIISLEKSFTHSGFLLFLAILISILTVIGYIALHFVPRKAYRLLYALTGLFLLAIFLVGQSMGLAGPVVTDCNRLGMLDLHNLKNLTWDQVKANEGWADVDGERMAIGSLGEPVHYCTTYSLLFAASFLNLILYIIALFDVQNVLLARVKSKTYGERFVEMGISS